MLKILQILKASKQMKRALIVAPLRVCHLVWPAEIEKWADFEGLTYSVVHGPLSKRIQALEKEADIYIINPEGFTWLLKDKALFNNLAPDVLVIDESTMYKRTSTQRFKALKPFLPRFRRRYILTGTPAPNGYLDLFGQVYLLDLGGALSPYITQYKDKYFQALDKFGWNWTMKPGADELIWKQIRSLVLRMDAVDYLKLPELTDDVIRVELPAKARKIYDELEGDFFTELEGGKAVVALNSGAAMTKCSQVANGGLFYEEFSTDINAILSDLARPTRKFEHIHDEKTNALLELIEQLQGTPLLVAYEYEHDLARILAALPKGTPVMGGGTSIVKSKQIETDWNAGKISVLPAHPAAMGHGLNLQGVKGYATAHVCWYNITWNYELYDQFIRRVRRQGQSASKVINHLLVARNTVDEVKLKAIRGKAKTQNGLLDALREYRKERKAKKA